MLRIGSTSGYFKLDSWAIAYILQLSTFSFCKRFLSPSVDPKGRWFDQMTQAARSITANIAEGSSRHQTSRESEMKLVDVARASANELAGDFMFWLSLNNELCWSRHDSRYEAVRQLRLEKPNFEAGELAAREAMRRVAAQKKRFDPWIEHNDAVVCANALLILCSRLVKMLENQLGTHLEQFKTDGGFTENMTHERLASIKEKAVGENSVPACPECGSPMRKMLARKGHNAGNEFWGCTNFPDCKGTRKLNEA